MVVDRTNSLALICSFKDEEVAAPLFIKNLINHLESRGLSFTLVLVDDGSTDQTSKLLKEFVSEKVLLICLRKNMGKIAAQAIGARKLPNHKGHFVFFDGDGQHHPSEIIKVLERGIESDRITIGQRSSQYKRGKLSFVGTAFLKAILMILGVGGDLRNSELIYIPQGQTRRILEDSNFGFLPINSIVSKEDYEEIAITIHPRIKLYDGSDDTRHTVSQLFSKAFAHIYSRPVDLLIRLAFIGVLSSLAIFFYGIYVGIYGLIQGDPKGVASIIVIVSFSTTVILFLALLIFGFLVVMNEWIKNRHSIENELK